MTMSFSRLPNKLSVTFRLLALLAICSSMGACASSRDGESSAVGPDNSSLPWNRPTSWEGPGVLGGQMQQAQGGGGSGANF